ncbi:hypothetical protein SARC_14948, partial [Sphaeroforma arctica JP610]
PTPGLTTYAQVAELTYQRQRRQRQWYPHTSQAHDPKPAHGRRGGEMKEWGSGWTRKGRNESTN